MIEERDIELCVLAGGRGSRLGADKSRIRIAGRPILDDLADRVAWRGPTLLVKTSASSQLAGEERFKRAVVDQFPGEGPLGGIVTALSETRAAWMIIVAIDQLRLGRAQLLDLISQSTSAGIACFEREDAGEPRLEPMPMLIATRLKDQIAQQFASGARSLRSIVTNADYQPARVRCTWPSDVWLNANSPADLAAIGATIAAESC